MLIHRHRLATPTPQPEAAVLLAGRTVAGPRCRSEAISGVWPSARARWCLPP